MKILFDHCMPARLRRFLPAHDVQTAKEMGWELLRNGRLLEQAQQQFEVMLTVDQNMPYQQNLKGRTLCVLVLVVPNNRLETLRSLLPQVEETLQHLRAGEFILIE